MEFIVEPERASREIIILVDDFCVLLARYGFAKDHETVREFIRSLPPLPEDGLGFAEELLQAYERIRFGQELNLQTKSQHLEAAQLSAAPSKRPTGHPLRVQSLLKRGFSSPNSLSLPGLS